MLRTKLISGEDESDLRSARFYANPSLAPSPDWPMLCVVQAGQLQGVFRTSSITTPTTTTVVSAPALGSLLLTDVVISADKVNNTTLTVQFTDGVDTAIIIAPDTINEAVNLSWSPAGRIQGWQDARIDVVTGGAGTPAVTILLGYIKMPIGVPFAEWDALR